jgi:hypothetical protein
MSAGNWLYLLIAIGMFAALSAVLAYQSWQQSLQGPDFIPLPGQNPPGQEPQLADSHHQVAA